MVFIPKCRRKVLYGKLKRHLGEVFHQLARQRESRILEGHLMPDHVHMLIAIPPKYPVSQVIGYLKGKSAIHLAGVYGISLYTECNLSRASHQHKPPPAGIKPHFLS